MSHNFPEMYCITNFHVIVFCFKCFSKYAHDYSSKSKDNYSKPIVLQDSLYCPCKYKDEIFLQGNHFQFNQRMVSHSYFIQLQRNHQTTLDEIRCGKSQGTPKYQQTSNWHHILCYGMAFPKVKKIKKSRYWFSLSFINSKVLVQSYCIKCCQCKNKCLFISILRFKVFHCNQIILLTCKKGGSPTHISSSFIFGYVNMKYLK